MGQRLLVLEQQEAVALLRARVLQDQGEVLDVPQGQAVLQRHHHVLQTPQTALGAGQRLPAFQGWGGWGQHLTESRLLPAPRARLVQDAAPQMAARRCWVPKGLAVTWWQFTSARARKQEAGKKWRREHRCGAGEGRSRGGPTFTVVRPSNVKDLICPFSRKTFSTLGMRRRASFFSMSCRGSGRGGGREKGCVTEW